MVSFYNAVLNTDLQPIESAPGFYRGKLAAQHDLIMCPNSVAEVVAEQNRQQFCFTVEDIEEVFAAAMENGGKAMNSDFEKNDTEMRGSLYDPDGNTIEFVQVFS